MSLLISSIAAWVPGINILGLGLKYGKTIGILLLVAGAYLWVRQSGYIAAVEQYKAERAEAIEKDAKENKEILKEAHKDELEHQTTITKSQSKLESEENEIQSLEPNQCLDVKLADIGLR